MIIRIWLNILLLWAVRSTFDNQKQLDSMKTPRSYLRQQENVGNSREIYFFRSLKTKSAFDTAQNQNFLSKYDLSCLNAEDIDDIYNCLWGRINSKSKYPIEVVKESKIIRLRFDTQYFLIASNIDQINMNWAQNKVYQLKTQPNFNLSQILESDRFFINGKRYVRICLVAGQKGNIVSFSSNQYSFSENCYLITITPAVILLGIYLLNKCYSQQTPKSKAKFYIKASDNEQQCSICLTNDSFGFMVSLQCKHVFHKACLTNWISSRNTCPYCKATTTLNL